MKNSKEDTTSLGLSRRNTLLAGTMLAAAFTLDGFQFSKAQAQQQQSKPNIIMIISDDTGFGDLGPYGGGEGRGMPTPNIDRLASEGMQFLSFYAQPSCTPGRAAMQTGRIPNRSGMTTVSFQGKGAASRRRSGPWHRCSRPAATKRSSPASGIWARLIMRFQMRRATMK